MNEAAKTYLDAMLPRAVQVLSLMDREQFSRTFGCFDRTYWAWKFTDFPGARFQEGVCFLSFLYATPLRDNPYHRNSKLLRWITAALDFWCSIQRPGGDFDEAYPFEHSLAATAFTSFYIAEAQRFLGNDLPADAAGRLRSAITRAGDWLNRNDETHGFLSNHLAAAAAALYHAYLVTGEKRFETRSEYFVAKILGNQSAEGWYEEYGGADPGYQTHGSFYLARLAELSDNDQLWASLNRSVRFLAHFLHPDGSLGGEYASRNTQTYYPAAFEMMADSCGTAVWITEHMRPSVESLAAAGLRTVDVYNLFPLLNNYVFAYLAAVKTGEAGASIEAPAETPGIIHFPEAGLVKVRANLYDLYIGISKGGVVKLFDRKHRHLVFSNAGYVGRRADGATISNQWFEKQRSYQLTDREVEIEGAFYQISRPVMSPVRFLMFRLFSLTLGRFQKPAAWLKRLLVNVLIYRKRDIGLRFRRRIVMNDFGIEIVDHLFDDSGTDIETLRAEETFTTIHMGSSRYFIPNELTDTDGDFHEPIRASKLQAGVERRHSIDLR